MTNENDIHNEQLKAVQAFLDKNVKIYEQPKTVHITNLTFDSETQSGQFECYLDEVKINCTLEYYFEMGKTPHLRLPLFHSPCGAPASYPQFEITWQTKNAILKAVEELYIRKFGKTKFKSKLMTYSFDVIENVEDYHLHYTRKNLRGTNNFDLEFGCKTWHDYSDKNDQVHINEIAFDIPERIIEHFCRDFDRYDCFHLHKNDGEKIIRTFKDILSHTINKNYAEQFIEEYNIDDFYKLGIRHEFVHHPKGVRRLLEQLVEYFESSFKQTEIVTIFGL